ncbi:MAG TPA: hypothetical protein VGC79_00925, partial [Polyangiaceae bacterium]
MAKALDVNQHHGELELILTAHRELVCQPIMKQTAIRQARQVIVRGEKVQPLRERAVFQRKADVFGKLGEQLDLIIIEEAGLVREQGQQTIDLSGNEHGQNGQRQVPIRASDIADCADRVVASKIIDDHRA